MVDVVVFRVVTRQVLERIPRQLISAVVIDGLDGGHGEKPQSLPCRHEGALIRNGCAKRVEKEALEGMVVESTKCIWDIEAVVSRMEGG